jgi:hypothetical protein
MIDIGVGYGLAFVFASISSVMVWYCRKLIVRYQDMLQDIAELRLVVESYGGHLRTVSELENYYGDPTLTSLLKHSKHIQGVFEDFELFNTLPYSENDELKYDRNQHEEEET